MKLRERKAIAVPDMPRGSRLAGLDALVDRKLSYGPAAAPAPVPRQRARGPDEAQAGRRSLRLVVVGPYRTFDRDAERTDLGPQAPSGDP